MSKKRKKEVALSGPANLSNAEIVSKCLGVGKGLGAP